jgi:hypothetical protein
MQDDSDISVVEDLTPEPQARGRWARAREAVLGIALLLGVLLWGGWQWWKQEYSVGRYNSGLKAEARKDWDAAFRYFASVRDFKDADRRADEIARMIAERDRQYYAASLLLHRDMDWFGALAAAQQVQRIQPGYSDIESIAEQAALHVYRDALPGTVALRVGPQARPPGLYYRTKDGWAWLEGSDASSRPRNFRASTLNRYIVYDVPDRDRGRGRAGDGDSNKHCPSTPLAGGDEGAASGSGPDSGTEAEKLAGRRLMLAVVQDGGLRFYPLAFDPAQFNWYWPGEQGIWAIRVGADGSSTSDGRLLSWFPRASMQYQSYASPTATPVVLSSSGWLVADLSPGGDHLLVVDANTSISSTSTRGLYITDADGTNPRRLYSYAGGFQSAQFSPDGRWVLASIYSRRQSPRIEERAIVLIDPAGQTAPRVLVRRQVNSYTEPFPPQLAAAFLPSGYSGRSVLITDWSGGVGRITLLDPNGQLAPQQVEVDTGASPGWGMLALPANQGTGIVLLWQVTPPSPAGSGKLVVLDLSPDQGPRLSSVPVEYGSALWGATLRGDTMVYTLVSGQSGNQKQFSVYTLILPAVAAVNMNAGSQFPQPLQSLQLQPTLIVTGTTALTHPYFDMTQGSVGTRLYAYIRGSELRARAFYGRSTEVSLESGVAALYEPSQDNWAFLR